MSRLRPINISATQTQPIKPDHKLRNFFIFGFITAAIFLGGFFLGHYLELGDDAQLLSPFTSIENLKKELPLLKYTIPNLAAKRFLPNDIEIERELKKYDNYTAYLFSYTSDNKKITGQLNIPNQLITTKQLEDEATPIIILLRGWVPEETYITGIGTRNAAAVFAENGYVTMAPDFLGYGESDPEPENSWETRFIKPINVIELIISLRANPTITFSSLEKNFSVITNPKQLGIWAHSNGGQVALTTLEAMGEGIPTTLWAPVTVPFPYSILFFSDEHEDEGRAMRLWLADFEENYDPRDFSLTQHLDKLTGPLQIHHGTADEAALKDWSDEFVDKIEAENELREEKNLELTELDQQELIELDYFSYAGANHNLTPGWDTAIQRDLKFFTETLGL